jgi:energy-coupling factor transport system substrate-specific component
MNATRRTLLASLLTALAIAAGYALAAIPNVELITLLVFVSGYLLGPALGGGVGAVAMAGHSTFNVMGAAIPPILAAQVACYALVGAAGGVAGPAIRRLPPIPASIAAALCGGVLVVGYQVVVGVVSFYTFTGESVLWAYIWGGLVFSSIHVAWNVAVFLVVLRPTLSVLDRHRAELQGGRGT